MKRILILALMAVAAISPVASHKTSVPILLEPEMLGGVASGRRLLRVLGS